MFPGNNSFWEIRGFGNAGMGIWKWIPPSKKHQEGILILPVQYYIVLHTIIQCYIVLHSIIICHYIVL